ncbi:Lrp/AsnC family transcriptional regulator [Alphaproteobacteria bacterium]|nr:Lrp/AsnC family transcriptional regulator [Alphaproteobacteria bacterium]
MNDKDKAIIAILERDARAPVSDIAKAVGMSRATVKSRITRLEEGGVIAGYTVIRGDVAETCGISGWALIGLSASHAEAAIAEIRQIEEIVQIDATNGKSDLAVVISTDTLDSFDRTLTQLRSIDGVEDVSSHLLLRSRVYS